MSRPDERYRVLTEHGPVCVVVRGDRAGLDPDLIDVRPADAAADVAVETPLRAFAAKMVELVSSRGAGDTPLSAAMLALLVKEKAAEDLARIERAARRWATG